MAKHVFTIIAVAQASLIFVLFCTRNATDPVKPSQPVMLAMLIAIGVIFAILAVAWKEPNQ